MAFIRRDQPLAETLVVSLAMMMRNELVIPLRNEPSPKKIMRSKQDSLIVGPANPAVRHSAATFTPFGYRGSGYAGLGQSLQVGGRAVLQYVGGGRRASAGSFDTLAPRWIVKISPIYAPCRS